MLTSESDDEAYISIASLIIFLLLLIYIVGGSYMEHKHCLFGHETGIAILLGMLVSLIIKLSGKSEEISEYFVFNNHVFFYLCLPPIIFASGFNMRRKRFFENIGYIMLFGILGTLVTFIMFTILNIAAFSTGMMWKYVPETG